MKQKVIYFLIFCIGFIALFGYFYQKNKKTTPALPAFSDAPSSAALSGYLYVLSGTVEKYGGNDTGYKEATSGTKVLVGESVATKANASAFVAIQGYVDTRLSSLTEVSYANLYPKNFVVQQKSGIVEYTVVRPISARILHSLVSIQPGTTKIQLADTTVTITVVSGSAKIALVDLENNTKVYDLSVSQKATIDDKQRTVKIF